MFVSGINLLSNSDKRPYTIGTFNPPDNNKYQMLINNTRISELEFLSLKRPLTSTEKNELKALRG